MSTKDLLKISDIVQILTCFAALAAMAKRRTVRDFPALTIYISLAGLVTAITVCLLFYRVALNIPIRVAYRTYFYTAWLSGLAEFVLSVFVIYGLYSNAMRPFPGLQRLGAIIFRWVGGVSLAVSLALAAGPQLFSRDLGPAQVFTELASRFGQGVGVLTLCLLIFVCFAIRPLGLTFRSHIFGVVLGLAVMSAVNLVQAAWFATVGAQSVYSPVYLISSIGFCVGLGVWTLYFALPEPERRLILLPTTSPFFLWNRISEVLGDAPGHVAVAGFRPSMLAAAEIQMLTAATSRETAAARARDEAELQGAVLPSTLPPHRIHPPALALSR
ncbi:MAG: hypothetical protein ACRYFU_18595 [Janthinobacterium lividum]